MLTRRYGMGLLSLAIMGTGAWAAEPVPTDLQSRIASLETQVQSLKAQQQAERNRIVEQEVKNDAERRSSAALTGGWKDGKFILQSDDGRFSLNPNFQFQFRYVASLNDETPAGDSNDQDGFEIRRAKFGFAGNAFSKDLTYSLVFAANRNGGAVSLEEAWARYKFADQWSVRGGMFKDPLSHEQQVSSKKQLTVDRSLLNETLIGGDDFVEGVGLLYGDKNNPLHAEIAFTDGSQSHNTDFRNTGSNFGVAARAEYKFTGDWGAYDDFSALNNKHDLLVLGAGADLTQTGSTNALIHTLDAQYELTNGLGFYAAYVGRYTDSDAGNRYDGGVLAQANYLLDKHWGIFGRYDFIRLDRDSVRAGASNTVHEITAGLNYYIQGHNAKFTLDAVFLPNGAPSNQTGIGILASDGSKIVLRGQFQLLF